MSLRERRESFTETVLRLTESNEDVMKGFGALAGDDEFADAAGRTREELDEAFSERRERRSTER